jgi:hypothetical protein
VQPGVTNTPTAATFHEGFPDLETLTLQVGKRHAHIFEYGLGVEQGTLQRSQWPQLTVGQHEPFAIHGARSSTNARLDAS